MRVAVVSDIHGNRQAFEAVLEAAEAASAEELWCLGDLVGYGADPDACVALARERAAICLVGNHDLAVCGDIPLDEFSRGAALAARWTRDAVSAETLDYLRGLAPSSARGGGRALPRQPARPGVGVRALAPAGRAVPRRAAPPGLPHRPLPRRPLLLARGGRAGGRRDPRRTVSRSTSSTGEWLLNPGSVGQPRDGDPRAAWLVLDTATWACEYRRTEYDVAGAAAAIRDAGLPESLAERLEYGQ